MDKKLKPCPFCGSDRLLWQSFEDHGLVKCWECSATIKRATVEEHFVPIGDDLYQKVARKSGGMLAAEAWNRRSPPG